MVDWHIPDVASQANQFDWREYYSVWICSYCGGQHKEESCYRVQEIEYHPNGAIKWVKLREPHFVSIQRFTTTAVEDNE